MARHYSTKEFFRQMPERQEKVSYRKSYCIVGRIGRDVTALRRTLKPTQSLYFLGLVDFFGLYRTS